MPEQQKLSVRLNALIGHKGFINSVIKHEISTDDWARIIRLVRRDEAAKTAKLKQ